MASIDDVRYEMRLAAIAVRAAVNIHGAIATPGTVLSTQSFDH